MNEDPFARILIQFPYRYELLLGLTFIAMFFWPMQGGTPAFLTSLAATLLLLDARSASQLKRNTEDFTMLDALIGRIPFRYEMIIVGTIILWGLWWFAAGMTGCMLGLAVVALALRARSSSQLKRGTAVTLNELT